MDLFSKCHSFTAAKEAMAAGLYPYFIPLSDTEGTEVVINGKKLIMETETWRYDRLAEISAKMREGYRSLGFDVGHTATPIIPLIIGDDMKTLLMWRALFDAGIYVNPVIPPAVPPNMSLLRTSYMATHSDEQLDRVLETVATVAKQAG